MRTLLIIIATSALTFWAVSQIGPSPLAQSITEGIEKIKAKQKQELKEYCEKIEK